MALFSSKPKKAEVEVKAPKAAKKTVAKKAEKTTKSVAVAAPSSTGIFHNVILRPHVTEKSGMAHEAMNIYTFEVEKNSTKGSIARSIKTLYKVTPLKIRTVTRPAQNVFVRGNHGKKSSMKKALVYLKKGDKIEFV